MGAASFMRVVQPKWFFGAFAVGLLFCYIMTPAPEVVVKFPSPYNVGKVVYKDKSDACFTYNAAEVACPSDKSLVKPQPVVAEPFRLRAIPM
jgi:hypothetical protein